MGPPQAARERMAAERAAAEHERDSVKEQLSLALSQTRALELACQEWVVEVQREARVRAEAPPPLCGFSQHRRRFN